MAKKLKYTIPGKKFGNGSGLTDHTVTNTNRQIETKGVAHKTIKNLDDKIKGNDGGVVGNEYGALKGGVRKA
jgi:hypothetical protein